ncbi:MAG: pyridoxamine 5'-phosphate oxidase family protein [Actinobacteria bacterium]|nr:pyridoxamine 5'-phosphate oxidase family protein [Actinomycetota bacterium]
MRWQQFAEAAPELATLGKKRFGDRGLALIGTLRKDGGPRISPIEPYIVDGELMLGMMWRSRKALDITRDPRVTLHSATCEREGTEGDFKLSGRAADVPDAARRDRYGDATEKRIDWRPDEPFHLFSLEIESASYIIFGAGQKVLRWSRDLRFERIAHPDD